MRLPEEEQKVVGRRKTSSALIVLMIPIFTATVHRGSQPRSKARAELATGALSAWMLFKPFQQIGSP